MPWSLLFYFDLIGTIAFSISGSFVAIRKGMDIFGVNVLAVTTACGGGLMRDLIIGSIPPQMFRNSFFVVIAVLLIKDKTKKPIINSELKGSRKYEYTNQVNCS